MKPVVRRLGVAMSLGLMVAACVVGFPVGAYALTPSAHVVTRNGNSQFGWSTPTLPASNTRISSVASAAGASTVFELKDSTAPIAVRFDLDLPTDATLVEDGSGGYFLTVRMQIGAAVIGHLERPWAVDANGKSIPTRYDLDGRVLVQTVATADAAFPVRADPRYTWGIVTGTVYLNKGETNNARSSWYVLGPLCTGVAAWFAPLGVVCGVQAGAIVYEANVAYNSGKCEKLKVEPVGITYAIVPQAYTGGYCS